jgi:hypothetical protein
MTPGWRPSLSPGPSKFSGHPVVPEPLLEPRRHPGILAGLPLTPGPCSAHDGRGCQRHGNPGRPCPRQKRAFAPSAAMHKYAARLASRQAVAWTLMQRATRRAPDNRALTRRSGAGPVAWLWPVADSQIRVIGAPTLRSAGRTDAPSRNEGVAPPHSYSLACMPLTVAAVVNSVVPFGSWAALNARSGASRRPPGNGGRAVLRAVRPSSANCRKQSANRSRATATGPAAWTRPLTPAGLGDGACHRVRPRRRDGHDG